VHLLLRDAPLLPAEAAPKISLTRHRQNFDRDGRSSSFRPIVAFNLTTIPHSLYSFGKHSNALEIGVSPWD
jgi:hypothetical protein